MKSKLKKLILLLISAILFSCATTSNLTDYGTYKPETSKNAAGITITVFLTGLLYIAAPIVIFNNLKAD